MARHLLYHLCPFAANQVWREDVEALRRHLGAFDGGRHVAVCEGPLLCPFDEVAAAFGADEVEFLRVANVPSLREVASFLPLFERVCHLRGGEVLWGHAKGVQTPYGAPVALWREAIHYLYLERAALMLELLEGHPVAGAFKKLGAGWNVRLSSSTWHYSGSWFWFRAECLFANPRWRVIEQIPHGIEPYPSLHFTAQDAACLFHEATVSQCNLYDLGYWRRVVSPALDRWKKEHP